MALTTVTVHGEILDPDTLTPAVGTVTFRTIIELRDVVDNVVYMPGVYVATLDVNGEFTINLPATNNPDISPLNWVYQVYISTTSWRETIYVQLPFAPGTTEFADLIPLDYDPCTGIAASAPLPPSPEDLFVLKTGDTMTGNLAIDANLQVGGDANVDGALTTQFTNSPIDVGQLLTIGMSSAIISGGEININADPTKIDISALTGYIVTYVSWQPLSPTNPTLTYVTLPAQVGITPAFQVTWYLVNNVGTLIQQAATPTAAQRRQNLVIGVTGTDAGIVIADQTLPVIPAQVSNQLTDLMDALGPFNVTGNLVGPDGPNLTFNKTSGSLFVRGFNYDPNFDDPHVSQLPAQTPVQFRHLTASTSGPIGTLLDVGSYDPNGAGIVTPVPGGANAATNFRVWAFAADAVTDQILVQYGQQSHASLTAALAAIQSGAYTPHPLTSSAALLGWISVIRTATNLSDPAQAIFTKAAKFASP